MRCTMLAQRTVLSGIEHEYADDEAGDRLPEAFNNDILHAPLEVVLAEVGDLAEVGLALEGHGSGTFLCIQ